MAEVFTNRAAEALAAISVFLVVAVLPVLMVASNRSAAAVLSVAAGFAIMAAIVEDGLVVFVKRCVARLRALEAILGIVFLCWASLSLLWSDVPGQSLVELCSLLLPVTSAFLLSTALAARGPRWAIRVLAVAFTFAAIGIWIEVVYNFPLGRLIGRRLDSSIFNRSTLTLVILFWPLAALLRKRSYDVSAVMFMVVVITVSLSRSETALFALIVASLTFVGARFAPRLLLYGVATAVLALVAFAPWIGDFAQLLLPSRFYDALQLIPARGLSAHEHVYVWQAFGASVHEHLWAGNAIGSSRWLWSEPIAQTVPESLRSHLRFLHPHDNFLQVWVELGLVGAVLFGAIVVAVVRRLARTVPSLLPARLALFACVAVVAATSHGAWQAWWAAVIGTAVVAFELKGPARQEAAIGEPRGGFVKMSQWPRRALAFRTLAFIHDGLMTGLAFVIAVMLRLGLKKSLVALPHYWASAALLMLIAAITGPLFGLNSGVWRYASLPDLRAIVKTSTTTIILFVLVTLFVPAFEAVPRSVPLGTWFVIIILLAGPRIVYRMWKTGGLWSDQASGKAPARVLLIGAGDGSERFVGMTADRKTSRYDVLGVIDERGRRTGRSIRGVPVLGNIDDIAAIVERLEGQGRRPESFIVTKDRSLFSGAMTDRVLTIAQAHGISVLRLPDALEVRAISGPAAFKPQPIVIEDLLHRDAARLDLAGIQDLVRGSRVLVTGAGGSIGSELCRQLAALGPSSLALLDVSEFLMYTIETELRRAHADLDLVAQIANVRERAQILRLFQEIEPQIIFHAAALKHVPIVERQPCEGLFTNALGTRNVADAAISVGAKAMVLISTDKAVNPTSVMGASKRVAELYCQAADVEEPTHFITVRFGNVLGSAGSVVPLFEQQIAAGGPITITHPEMKRYFLTIPEAVQLVLQATNHGMKSASQRGAIFVLDMGRPVKIVDLAKTMVRLAGLCMDEDIKMVFTGLRPGEKLYEELFDINEPPLSTDAEGVLVAMPRITRREDIVAAYDRLEEEIRHAHARAALQLLMEMVPEYQPDRLLQNAYSLAMANQTFAAERYTAAKTVEHLA